MPPDFSQTLKMGRKLNEDDWADGNPAWIKKLAGYQKSKVRAERAGWEYCRENSAPLFGGLS